MVHIIGFRLTKGSDSKEYLRRQMLGKPGSHDGNPLQAFSANRVGHCYDPLTRRVSGFTFFASPLPSLSLQRVHSMPTPQINFGELTLDATSSGGWPTHRTPARSPTPKTPRPTGQPVSVPACHRVNDARDRLFCINASVLTSLIQFPALAGTFLLQKQSTIIEGGGPRASVSAAKMLERPCRAERLTIDFLAPASPPTRSACFWQGAGGRDSIFGPCRACQELQGARRVKDCARSTPSSVCHGANSIYKHG